MNLCSSLESAAVTAADAFLHPSSRLFANSSFISVRNAAGGVEDVLRISATVAHRINLSSWFQV